MQGPQPGIAPDRVLVRAAKRGDRGAFEALYHRHVGRVYAICRRLSADPVVAEELTQDAFFRAWERLATLRTDAFGGWIRQLTVRLALDDRRAHQRRVARVVTSEHAEGQGEPSPGVTLDLERAVALLPAKARHVFVLNEVEGLTHAEIASLTGVSVGTSKAQLHRARQLLRELLA